MKTGITQSGLTAWEYAMFVAACERYGYQAEQFQTSTDILYCLDMVPSTAITEINVTYLRSGSQRSYQVTHTYSWLCIFENDLCDGFFVESFNFE